MKILLLITTYKREDKLLRFLNDLADERLRSVRDSLEVLVSDDDPNSTLRERIEHVKSQHPLHIKYVKNKKNLGQGANALHALSANRDYAYYWLPGDDDRLVPEEIIDLIGNMALYKPSVAALEFRQGKELQQGTFFEGPSRIVTDIEEAIDVVSRFGKGTSAIFFQPTDWALALVHERFAGCMYQDKALAVLSYLESEDRKVYLKTEMTGYCSDSNFGQLRYSMRVFINLNKVIDLAIIHFNKRYNAEVSHSLQGYTDSVFHFWLYGIKNHFNPKTELSYTRSRLLKEIFIFPFKYIYRRVSGKHPNFEN